jgi:dUTP pyrophosphatase
MYGGKMKDIFDRLRVLETAKNRLENLLLNNISLPFKKLHKNAILPAKAGDGEACYDICCVADDEFEEIYDSEKCEHSRENSDSGVYYCRQFYLNPGKSKIFRTGLSCEIPNGRAIYLWDRSGMGAIKNIHRLAGVIDSTYRGEILVSLINLSEKSHVVKEGDKIIQAQLSLVLPATPVWVDELNTSYRGENGFGSTGR